MNKYDFDLGLEGPLHHGFILGMVWATGLARAEADKNGLEIAEMIGRHQTVFVERYDQRRAFDTLPDDYEN